MDKETQQKNIIKNEMRRKKTSQKSQSDTEEPAEVVSKSNDNYANMTLNKTRTISDVILANIIVLSAVCLSAFIPVISLALPVLLAIYFEVGLSLFVLKKERGDYCKYEDLFVSIKKYIRIFCTAVVKMVMVIFGTILLIVPGVIFLISYSFAGLILAESDDLDVKGTLMLSKELTKGFRWQICFWGLLSLAAVCVVMTLMFIVILIFDIFLTVPSAVYIVLVLGAGIFALVILAMPMMQLTVADCYIMAKSKKTQSIS